MAVSGAALVAAGFVVVGLGPATAQVLPVSSVTASSYEDPHLPGNTIDGNLSESSRWSAQGDGAWIRYDLGAIRSVKSVAVAWAQGNRRVATFDVQASLDDSTWTTVLGGAQSSGATLGLECYVVWPTEPRYVRIIGHGNTANDWNSIIEVEIHDAPDCDTGSTPPTAVPPPPPSPPGGTVPVKAACRSTGEISNGTSTRTGFPTDATTGPEVGGFDEDNLRPSGVSGTWTITTNDTVVEGVYHNGLVQVNADNVTIRNSVICGTGTHLIRNNGANLLIENSIIRAERGTVSNPDTGEPCQSHVAFGNFSIRRTELTGCVDGVKVSSSVEIQDSWFHDNYTNRFGNGAGTHNDTVQSTGTRTNRFIFVGNAAYQDACTSNRHFQLASTQTQTGPIDVLRIQDNFFYGIKLANIDRTTTVADGRIAGNTLAGSATRGPFSPPLWSGAGMGGASRAGNVYESGESADSNFGSNYTCVGG